MFDTEKPTNDNESDPTNNAVNPTVDSSETNPESMDADIKSGKLGEDYQLDAASISEEELWDQIGLHKTLGGNFFRNFVFMIITAVIGLLLTPFIYAVLIPWPTATGYYNAAGGLLSFAIACFDVGTAYGVQTFIAQYAIKDKRRMFQYIQWYVWYSMFVGIIGMTFISWWILVYTPSSDIAYLGWILLFLNSKQYPGMLGTFQNALSGIQRYDKVIIISFLNSDAFALITQVVFILGGKYLGQMYPAIGPLMGISIGMVFGYYVNNFFVMFLSLYYLKKILKIWGFTLRELWAHDFDWKLGKQCIVFGFGVSWASLLGSGIGLLQLTMSLNMVPGYTTWQSLASLGSGIAGSINMGNIDLTAPLSESLNNKKKKLSQYYLAQAFKYWGFIFFAMGGIITVLIPIVQKILFIIPSIANQYSNALAFIIPGIVAMILNVPNGKLQQVIVTSYHVWIKSWLDFINMILGLCMWVLFIYVLHIWTWGIVGIIILFVYASVPGQIFSFIVYIIYIPRHIFKIKIGWWQTFGASILTYFCVVGIGYAFVDWMFLPMMAAWEVSLGQLIGAICACVVGLLVILLGFMLIVFPLFYGLFGGWDDAGLEILRKSYLLSGPSKMFIKLIYWFSLKGSQISPLTNRFPIEYKEAMQEMRELVIMKRKADAEGIRPASP